MLSVHVAMADLSNDSKIKLRENTIEEKRKMRRDRNKRKKMERRQKREELKVKRAKEIENTKEAVLEAQQYKSVAEKYSKLWKKTEKRRKETLDFKESPSTTVSKLCHVLDYSCKLALHF